MRITLKRPYADGTDAPPSRFGVLRGDLCGFPNGRRLGDDVTDIELRVVGGLLKGNALVKLEDPKKLSERWHTCPYCGFSCHRDENAARNARKKGGDTAFGEGLAVAAS